MDEVKERVCVTGAGGYVASWLVKLMLSKGYTVHGTVRNPEDPKNSHLTKIVEGSQKLQLFQADLTNYDSLHAAIKGCNGVFHVATPVPPGSEPILEVELVETAVVGTLNVLKACSEAKIKRVVVVSSTAAVEMNPNWPNDQVMDEACWSDEEYCRKTKNWYFLSKTVAEKEALEYGRRTDGLEVVTVCPSIVIGPMLQSTVNGSSWVLIKILKDGVDRVENKVLFIVDVREVAEALLLTYEKPEAEGRYICSSYMVRMRDLVEKLRSVYPNYNYPKNFIEVKEEKISSEKLQRMGWKFRSLEETLADSVKSYQEAGVIHRC